MFKRFPVAALAALSLLASIPASADYVVKDGAAATQTFGSFSLSGVQFPKHVMVDPTTGAAIGVAANPLSASITNFPATQAITAGALPLPAGAATAAAQATGNGSLSSIDGKLPAKGPAAAASATPVTLATDGTFVATTGKVETVVPGTPVARSLIIPVGATGGTVGAGGSAAAVNDVLTFVGGTCSVQPQATVTAVSSGAVTNFSISRAGSCTVLPATLPLATTSSGAGTGTTINPLYASIPTQVMASNATRRVYRLQAQGYTAYWNDAGTASADYLSYKLPADALYETPPHAVTTAAVSAVCACAVPLPLKAMEQ